jgi:WD40 repeat protein/serine/threonine protein kinase
MQSNEKTYAKTKKESGAVQTDSVSSLQSLSDQEAIDLIYRDFLEKKQSGVQPNPNEYLERFPKYRSELERQFQLNAAIEDGALDDLTKSSVLGTRSQTRGADPLAGRSGSNDANILADDFRLGREIGRGAMGVVYEAEQISLRRKVAVKILPRGAALDPQRLQRFRNEAQAAASIECDGIVPVLLICDRDDLHFFVMRYIDGPNLADVIEYLREHKSTHPLFTGSSGGKHRTSPSIDAIPEASKIESAIRSAFQRDGQQGRRSYFDAVARLGEKVARSLAHAHFAGVIHRDIKPSNLMLGQDGTVWITDFGLAHLEDSSNMTATGDVVGTARYMSPEQASGNSATVDRRADIYSLAVTLYELLTLQPAYPAKDRQQLLKQIAFEEPTSLRRIDPEIPSELEIIVQKAMSKDMDERYTSAQELADDLRLFLDNRPIKAKPPTLAQIITKWTRRNPAIAWASFVCCVLALIGSLFVALRERQHATDLQRRLAQQYLRRGQAACDDGFVVQGLHWFARGLDVVPRRNGELRDVIAQNLAEWAPLAISPRAVFAHENPIRDLAYSPDNTKLATVDVGGGVKLWSSETGELLHELQGHTQCVSSVAFSPDGARILTGSRDSTARLWSAETGETLGILNHESLVWDVAFPSDGTHLLTETAEGIHTWSAQTLEIVSKIEFDQRITRATLDTQGPLALAADGDHIVRIWSVQTGEPVGVPMKHESQVLTSRFSPDGTRVLTGTEDGEVRMWSADNGSLSWTTKHYGKIVIATFDPQGSLVLTAGEDGVARLWSAETGTPKSPPLLHGTVVVTAAFSPNGQYFVTIDHRAFIRVWSTTRGELLRHPTRFDTRTKLYLSKIVFDRDGARLALSPFENEAFELDISDLQPRAPLDRFDRPTFSAAFSRDGSRVVTGSWVGNISLWSTETGKALGAPLQYDGVTIWDLAFSPNEPYALAACSDGTVRILGVQDDQLVEKTSVSHGSGHMIRSVAFSPDGNTVVTGAWNGTARMWSAMTCQELVPALPHPNIVEDIAFSPDGELVATACGDGIVRIWSTDTGELIGPPLQHLPSVLAVAISPDGKEIVTGGRDHLARIWNIETRKPTERVLEHHGAVDDAVYSADGMRIVTASDSGDVYVWSAAAGERVGPPVVSREEGVNLVVVDPRGKRVLITGDFGAELWELAESQRGTLDEPGIWVRAVTGKEMTASGALKWLDRTTWRECQRMVNQQRKEARTE